MKTLIDTIKDKLKYLPNDDIRIANELLEKRRIESLKEIVDSALYKAKKNRVKYQYIDIDGLESLQIDVYDYWSQLALPDDCYLDYENYGDI